MSVRDCPGLEAAARGSHSNEGTAVGAAPLQGSSCAADVAWQGAKVCPILALAGGRAGINVLCQGDAMLGAKQPRSPFARAHSVQSVRQCRTQKLSVPVSVT